MNNDDLTKAATAVRANPKDPAAWTKLGQLLQAQGQREKAKTCFENAQKLAPPPPLPTSRPTVRPIDDAPEQATPIIRANPKNQAVPREPEPVRAVVLSPSQFSPLPAPAASLSQARPPQLEKPGKLQTVGFIYAIDGLLNIGWGIALIVGLILSIFGICLIPLAFYPIILGLIEFVYAYKLLSDPVKVSRPPRVLSFMQMTTLVVGDFIGPVMGIITLTLLDDAKVKTYFDALAQHKAQALSAKHSRPRASLVNLTIQAHLDKTRAYKEQIDTMVRATSGRKVHARLQDLAAQVNDWTQAIEAIATRVDNFQQNTLIYQDLEAVPQSIERLEAQLANETDEATRLELQQTLANRKNQLLVLERLQNTMKRAEMKMESTLSSLGTFYSQMLTAQSTDHMADYSRLSTRVDEEVRTLQDHLEALEEVKLGLPVR